jgi:hypothetical protein
VARAVAAGAGLSQAEAEKRVDAIFAQVRTAPDKFREATEAARKAGIILRLSVASNAEPIGYEVNKTPWGDGSASAINSGTMEASRQESYFWR